MNGSSSNADDIDDVVSSRIEDDSEVRLLGVLDVLLTSIVDWLLEVLLIR